MNVLQESGNMSLRTMAGEGCRVVSVGRRRLSCCVGAAVAVLLVLAADRRSQLAHQELLEVDGIQLDRHAAEELSGAGAVGKSSAISMHLSHMSGKGINKLLKDNEQGEIDGIALDSHAMAELYGGASSHARASHAAAKQSKTSSRAQLLLDEGKQDLDSRHWKLAVQLFGRAKHIWKRAGNNQYHWASSLENDVLRLHPGAKPAGHAAHARRTEGRQSMRRPGVSTAVKELSNGHQFRSLYGLLRDKHAMKAAHRGETIAQKAVAEARKVVAPYRSIMDAPAHTQTLTQVNGKSSKLDAAIASAEKELERKGKMELLHEKAKIVQMARELAHAAATRAVRSEVRLGAPPTEMVRSEGEASARSQALAAEESEGGTTRPMSEYVRRQNAEMSSRAMFPANEAHLPVVEKVNKELMREVPAAAEAALDGHRVQTDAWHAASPYDRFHKRGRFHYDLDQEQARYPSAAAPFPPKYQQVVAKEPSSPFEMREQVHGHDKVPILNINLPHGQVVPPGQYYMDGSLVQDLAGHWDYVGKLVPASPRESAV